MTSGMFLSPAEIQQMARLLFSLGGRPDLSRHLNLRTTGQAKPELPEPSVHTSAHSFTVFRNLHQRELGPWGKTEINQKHIRVASGPWGEGEEGEMVPCRIRVRYHKLCLSSCKTHLESQSRLRPSSPSSRLKMLTSL